ncbi:MAG: hypothetical protein KBD53_05940 [Candidatus Omnitrophica bacterium]|nr:hypothetical protein [Candidatus Omnitrophota bacterium]
MLNRVILFIIVSGLTASGIAQAQPYLDDSESKMEYADTDTSDFNPSETMDQNEVELSPSETIDLLRNADSIETPETPTVNFVSSETPEGYITTSIAYPTGKESSSTVLLEKRFPAKGMVGQEFSYTIQVKNLTDLTLENVIVLEKIPDSYILMSSEPRISNRQGINTSWNIGSLMPHGAALITVVGKSSDKNSAPCCAQVLYDLPALCHKTVLQQPSVALKIDAPKMKMMCDEIELTYTISNTGDTILTDLLVQSVLPRGITTQSGSQVIEFPRFFLPVGESKILKEMVHADKAGDFEFSGTVKGKYVSSQAAAVSTKIGKPIITIDINVNKDKQYIGRDMAYTIDLKNTSDIDAPETMVVVDMPTNTAFKSASQGGREVGNIVGWEIGRLKAAETKKMDLILTATGPGIAKTRVGAQASCSDPIVDTTETEVVGISALQLDVVDMVDPIEIDGEAIYIIKVMNQGTADANNVKISASFDGMDYISSDGETMGMMDINVLSFRAVTTIAPKESVSWKVKLKGKKEGDIRFKVSLTSDELTQPVEEAESTFVY